MAGFNSVVRRSKRAFNTRPTFMALHCTTRKSFRQLLGSANILRSLLGILHIARYYSYIYWWRCTVCRRYILCFVRIHTPTRCCARYSTTSISRQDIKSGKRLLHCEVSAIAWYENEITDFIRCSGAATQSGLNT